MGGNVELRAAVLGPPFEASPRLYDLLAYERWLSDPAAPSSPSSYLFLEPRLRFFPEADDVIVLIAGVRLERRGKLAVLQHPESGTRLPLEGLELPLVERILANLDGKKSLLATQIASECTAAQFDAFLRHTFGRVTLCPDTVHRYETQLSSSGLVRTPGSPYELDRCYWSNMIDVRRYFTSHCQRPLEAVSFASHIKEMHVLALIGQSGRSYYRPNSPILGKAGARAGAFYETATKTRRELGLTLLIDGPRVSAPFVGGKPYHELLYRSLDDERALEPERELTCETQPSLTFGRVTRGMARSDEEPSHWYLFPRPITAFHLERLADAHNEAVASPKLSREAWLQKVGSFHWQFVRLHPFACANQSLAMNLCNAHLERHGVPAIPHLILDQLALRLTQTAYERLFIRAVNVWSISAPSALEKHRELMRLRTQLERFLHRLGEATSPSEASQMAVDDPDGARASLLTDQSS
jgi:hypothetical protein